MILTGIVFDSYDAVFTFILESLLEGVSIHPSVHLSVTTTITNKSNNNNVFASYGPLCFR